MPEISLDRKREVLVLEGVPGTKPQFEIPYASFEAAVTLSEVADGRHTSIAKVIKALEKGKTIEF